MLGMSGGVDSTYAAHKLAAEGHTVEGAVLQMHEYTDVAAAREAAESLNIPLHVIDCRTAFEERVVSAFVSEYLSARTPNPCVICNSEVKFRFLLDYALANGFDRIATGHYARVTSRKINGEPRYAVARARDKRKDQTYMLWRLPQDILARLTLPLADDEKIDVVLSARTAGLGAADRDESQEICFIPSGDYAAFIEERTQPSPHGAFINNEGKVLGEHEGIIRYTVGQRKGLGVAMGKRVFVTDIDPVANTVTLSENDSFDSVIELSGMVFSGIPELEVGEERELTVKIRYLAPPVACVLRYLGEGRGVAALAVPMRAVTPGQSAVFYDGELLAAGGFICRKHS